MAQKITPLSDASVQQLKRLSVGERIASLRDTFEFSRGQLASYMGIPSESLSEMERNQRPLTIQEAEVIAQAFEVDPSLLLDARGESDRPTPRVRSRAIGRETRMGDKIARVQASISLDGEKLLQTLSKEKSVNKAEIVREALTAYFQNLGYQSHFRHEDVGGERFISRIEVRSAKQALFHSKCLIQVFEEALDYDSMRQHNQPPPTFRIEDKESLAELRKLVTELKQLNAFLENIKSQKKSTETTLLQKNLNVFLNKYSATLGYGAGVMTLGAIASLLYQLGAGEIIFDHVLKKVPGR